MRQTVTMEIPDIIGRLSIMIIRGILISPGGIMTGIATKGRNITMGTGIMNTGAMNILTRVTEAVLMAVTTVILTGITTVITITRGIGLHGTTGQGIKESIRTGSVRESITVIMMTISFSGFATRTAAHACSIQSEGNAGRSGSF